MMNRSREERQAPELPIVHSRRSFLEQCAGVLGSVAVIGVVSPLLGGCEPTTNGPIGPGTGGTGGNDNTPLVFDVSALVNDGDSLATTTKGPDGFMILLTRLGATEYAALSTRCTHESCSVSTPAPKNGPISCPCHASRFALDGAVLSGPASQPLTRYTTTYDATTRKLSVTVA